MMHLGTRTLAYTMMHLATLLPLLVEMAEERALVVDVLAQDAGELRRDEGEPLAALQLVGLRAVERVT